MKKVIRVILSLAFLTPALIAAEEPPEIHCKHFFYGYPLGTAATNDLIIRDIYALSSNDETKFADWVAYRLDCRTVTGVGKHERKWMTDPWLAENETLEATPESADDYREAYKKQGYDRGHLAPLASFKGTVYGAETNYYSNITPQLEPLNRGPWAKVEDAERDLVNKGHTVYVLTGPLYDGSTPMPRLRNCPEEHTVPTAYWKIVAIQPDDDYDSIRVAAFIFEQDTASDADVLDHLVTVRDIEQRSGLDFMWELPDEPEDIENQIETRKDEEWAREYF